MPTLNRRETGKPWVVKHNAQEGRENPNQDIYQSYRWRLLSKRFRQVNPLCAECLKSGRPNPSPAQVTDHIKSINQGGDPWKWNNLQGLCNMHHNKKSQKEGKQ